MAGLSWYEVGYGDICYPRCTHCLRKEQEGSEVHARLALLVAGLADAEAKLGGHREDDGAAHYDMYDDDSLHDGWQEEHQAADEQTVGGMCDGGPRGDHCNDRPAEWRPEGPGRWTRAGVSSKGTQQPQPKETAATGVHTHDQDNGEDGSGGGKAQGSIHSKGDGGAASTGKGGTPTDDGGDGDGACAGKHRRRQSEAEEADEARMAADARRADELHRQLQYASAAQEQSYREGGGGFGSQAALSVAAQRFVLDVQKAQAQANEMGVEARAEDGRSLLELSPAELRQWTQDHLGNDGMHD